MIPSLIPFLGTIIDKIFPDADSANKAKLEILKLEQAGELKQLEVNKAEANNSSVFVSGWRPFIGWVCGSVFAYTYLLQPLLVFLIAYSGHPVILLPKLDNGEVTTVLLGMLGLGGMRTFEKLKGVAKK